MPAEGAPGGSVNKRITPEMKAASVEAELTRQVTQFIPGAQEKAPDPKTRLGLHWRIFDVVSNWLILILAIINLLLVFFNFTYLDLRHVYQQNGWHQLVTSFDKIKGIEPHRATEAYSRAARKAFQALHEQPESPEATAAIAEMQQLSLAMLKEDPFVTAGLRGTSEHLKSKFRRHEWERHTPPEVVAAWNSRISPTRMMAVFSIDPRPWDKYSVTASMIGSEAAAAAKGAPNRDDPPLVGFWSEENLSAKNLQMQEYWFTTEIQPLLDRNYWQTYGENGEPNDRFWVIDCMFLPFFLLEFVIRGTLGVKRGVYASFGEFFGTRWFDVVYFLPVVVYALPPSLQGPVHLLRVISVGARMERLGLINPVAIVQARVAKVLDMITDIVNVKLLSNYQDGVRRFDLEESMNTLTPAQRAQLASLIEKNLNMVVGRVLPDIMDEAERVITRSAQQALEQAPAYRQLKSLPLFGALPEQLIQRVVTETIAQMQVTMLKTVSDPENVRLTKELITAITESMLRHMAEVGTEEQVKAMVIDVLEEQKKRILAN